MVLPALFVSLVLSMAAAKKSHGIGGASSGHTTNLNQSTFSFGYLWVKLNSTEGAAARGKLILLLCCTQFEKRFL
jgi:hypothetical protein